MNKDYTVEMVNTLGQPDENGNTAYSVKFADEGAYVFMLAKKAPISGEVEYGNIFDATSKANKPYKRFKRVAKEEAYSPSPNKKVIDNTSMYKCNAMNNATALVIAGTVDYLEITDTATIILNWFNAEEVAAKELADTPPPALSGPVLEDTTDYSEDSQENFMDGEIDLSDIPFN